MTPSGVRSSPGYGIATLASLTGLSQDVIRVWERRYSVLSPGRSSTGRRLYNEEDLARLRLLAQLTGQGHSIGTLASLSVEQLTALLPPPPSDDEGLAAARTCAALLEAFAVFDRDRAVRLLGRASLAFSSLVLCEQVLGPALDALGEGWVQGRVSIAQEHAATSIIRAHLLGLFQGISVPPSASVSVVATLAGEGHDLGALFVALLAAEAGQRVVFLGGSLPVSEIILAVESTRASRLMLSLVAQPMDEAQAQLDSLSSEVAPGVTILVGGRGASRLRLPARCRCVGLASLWSLSFLAALSLPGEGLVLLPFRDHQADQREVGVESAVKRHTEQALVRQAPQDMLARGANQH